MVGKSAAWVVERVGECGQDQSSPASARAETTGMSVAKGQSMEKWLCWGSMGVAGGLLVLFLLDLVLKFPFRNLSTFVDILALLACGTVLYLSWDALRDLR
jgi:hypothetical protein